MMMQDLVVYAVVALCTVYSVWVFLPASLKRRAAAALMASTPRLRTSSRLQKLAAQGGGCGTGCDNCGSSAAKPTADGHKIRLFRRHPAGQAAPPPSTGSNNTLSS